MTGATHGRGANNSGYIRVVRLATGEARYQARWRNKFLGSFETRARAQRAIDDAKGVKPTIGTHGGDAA